MNENDTITVKGYFGNKQMTKAEYAKRWTDHVQELRMLSWDIDWQKKVDRMMTEVGKMAEEVAERKHSE